MQTLGSGDHKEICETRETATMFTWTDRALEPKWLWTLSLSLSLLLSVSLSLFPSLCFPLSVSLSLFPSLCFPLSVSLSLFPSPCFPLSLSLSLPLSFSPSLLLSDVDMWSPVAGSREECVAGQQMGVGLSHTRRETATAVQLRNRKKPNTVAGNPATLTRESAQNQRHEARNAPSPAFHWHLFCATAIKPR